MKTDFYVYEHWRPDTNQCFYVGKGRKWRAYSKRGRNQRWMRTTEKLKRNGLSYDVRIIKTGLTNDEAIALEIECIKFWKEVGVELVNITDGGEGATGLVHSLESRMKMSVSVLKSITDERRAEISVMAKNKSAETRAKIAENNRNRSAEVRARMSKALCGREAWNRGKSMPEEFCNKISESLIGNKRGVGRRLSEETRAKIGVANSRRRLPEGINLVLVRSDVS